MNKMINVIMKAVMLISINDDLELNQLMQYIMIEEFSSGDLKIDWYDDDVTGKKDFINSKRYETSSGIFRKGEKERNVELLSVLFSLILYNLNRWTEISISSQLDTKMTKILSEKNRFLNI